MPSAPPAPSRMLRGTPLPLHAPVPSSSLRQRRSSPRSTPVSTAAAAASLRTLYPAAAAPRASGTLCVAPPHVLHYEEYGNAAGVPALVVHGGPGAGCFPNHARFFDPTHYRIVLLDQRGCGRSTPRGCLDGNDTDALVADIEALRVHLGVGRWTLFGGSWGVALSLAYAAAHPHAVRALLLRGVCLMRRAEIDWAFRAGGRMGTSGGEGDVAADGVPLGGAAALFPGAWRRFTAAVGVPPAGGADPVGAAFAALCGEDAPRRADVAAAWLAWGGAIGTPPPGGVQQWTGAGWAIADVADARAGAAALALASASPPAPAQPAAAAAAATSAEPAALSSFEAQALLEAYYCLHQGFFPDSSPLLSRLAPLRAARVPAFAVHGRLDALCPVGTAYALHAAWPELELRVVGGEGHSMYNPGVTHALLCASDAFRALPM